MGIDYKTLGKNIKFYRKQKSLTQERLAEQLDLSVGFISQVERGITKMSLDTLINFCDLLDCSVGDMLDNARMDRFHDTAGDFIALYGTLSKEDQMLFYYMLKAYREHL